MFKALLYRPVWLLVTITSAILILSLILMVSTASRGLQRLDPIQTHLIGFTEAEEILLSAQKILLRHIGEGDAITPRELDKIRHHIAKFTESNKNTNTAIVNASLHKAYDALAEQGAMPIPSLSVVLQELNTVLKSETNAHNLLLSEARRAAQLELEIATTMLIILPILGVLLLFLIGKRILAPLKELGWLMSQLARRDYAPAPSNNNVDPLLRPLVGHYNSMVERLAELEKEHANRQISLELQISSAAKHLLYQQRTLANAERLAAVGELAASLAHELRNPLAGIQMALLNLREEVNDPEHIERLELVSRELARITSLLNTLLEQSRQLPEPLTNVHLAKLTDEIFTLARYQLPERIALKHTISSDLRWLLPENELRRTLLNLILNAYQAIGQGTGSIRISASADQNNLIIEVTDNGPGFPESLLKTNVRAFKTTRPEGTGLGLVSVQHFVNGMHGKLQLRNVTPRGACVSLTIPTNEPVSDEGIRS